MKRLLLTIGILMATGCTESHADKNSDRAWHGYYIACFNVRYREIDGDDGLKAEWEAIRDRWKIQYDSAAPSVAEMDELYVAVQNIQQREPPVKLKVANQAQDDTNKLFDLK